MSINSFSFCRLTHDKTFYRITNDKTIAKNKIIPPILVLYNHKKIPTSKIISKHFVKEYIKIDSLIYFSYKLHLPIN